MIKRCLWFVLGGWAPLLWGQAPSAWQAGFDYLGSIPGGECRWYDAGVLLYEPALPVAGGWGWSVGQRIIWPGAGVGVSRFGGRIREGRADLFAGGSFMGNTDLRTGVCLMGGAKELGAGWRVGITTGAGSAGAGMYGRRSWLLYSTGLSKWWKGGWVLSATWENPVRLPAGLSPPVLVRTSLAGGLAENISMKLLLVAEEDKSASFFCGLCFIPDRRVWARLGWLSHESVWMAGVGMKWGHWRVEPGTWFHLYTGLSPSVTVHFNREAP